jgi:hypothetical protein
MATNRESRRTRRSGDEWRQVLSGFSGSGLAVEAFCARAGISDTSFYRWRGRLGASVKRPDAIDHPQWGSFIDAGPLRSEVARPARLELTLDLGGGLQLHLVRG